MRGVAGALDTTTEITLSSCSTPARKGLREQDGGPGTAEGGGRVPMAWHLERWNPNGRSRPGRGMEANSYEGDHIDVHGTPSAG